MYSYGFKSYGKTSKQTNRDYYFSYINKKMWFSYLDNLKLLNNIWSLSIRMKICNSRDVS